MDSHETQILDPEGGVNQTGLRDQNARLVLSYVRRHGAMASAEIARRSGLSAQTVSNITRALEAQGLLQRHKAIKGKVGKPSVPVALNPSGVHALGLSIGRRSSELVLVDFNGHPVETVTTAYPYPNLEGLFVFLRDAMARIFAKHPAARETTSGIGVARPSKVWDWLDIMNAPPEAMRSWENIDLRAAIAAETGLDTFIENDATSACVAEQLLGHGEAYSDFAYIFIGAFIGGGLVLNGKIFSGRTGNAAAFGPIPVPDGKGGATELLNVASLHVLESALLEAGLDPMDLRRSPDDWSFCAPQVDAWIGHTSQNLAWAIAAITAIVEVEAILIEGAMPQDLRDRLARATQASFAALDLAVIERPEIRSAQVGKTARSLGAALLPIHARYFIA